MRNNSKLSALINNNTVVLILSLLIAVLAWFLVAYNVDTMVPMTVSNVPVTLDVENSPLSRLDLEVISISDFSVDVEIYGPRAIVGNIKPSDLLVKAKFGNISGPGTYAVSFDATMLRNQGIEVNGTIPESIAMRVDRVIDQTFNVELELPGLVIAEGYIMDQEYVFPTQITVTGPETEMKTIERCVVVHEFAKELAQTNTFDEKIKLLNADGEEVNSPFLTVDSETVTLTLPVLKKKTVPVTLDFVNVPAGFDLETLRYEIQPREIEIAGASSSIAGVTELHLGYIDLRLFTPDAYMVYDTPLPSGYISVEDIGEITVEFFPEGFEEISLNVNEIRVVNEPEDYKVSILSRNISNVVVYGPKEILEELTTKDLVAQIDMLDVDIRTGQITMPVEILIPSNENCWVYGDSYTVRIEVSELN